MTRKVRPEKPPFQPKKMAKPARIDEEAEFFIMEIPKALMVLMADERFMMRDVTRMEFVPGTDKGITIKYMAGGNTFNRHVEPSELYPVQEEPEELPPVLDPSNALDGSDEDPPAFNDNTSTGRFQSAEPNEGNTPKPDNAEE